MGRQWGGFQTQKSQTFFHCPALCSQKTWMPHVNHLCVSEWQQWVLSRGDRTDWCLFVHFYVWGFLASTLSKEKKYISIWTPFPRPLSLTHTSPFILTVTCLSRHFLAIAYNLLRCPTPLAGTNHRLILPCWDINLLGTKRATLCCLTAAVWLREAFFVIISNCSLSIGHILNILVLMWRWPWHRAS